MKSLKIFIFIVISILILIGLIVGCNKTTSGAISAGTVTATNINVNYSYNGCAGTVYLKTGIEILKDCGTGSGSGSYTYTDLKPNTNYQFILTSIPPGTILAIRTIKTNME
jgi:hypothetical protein